MNGEPTALTPDEKLGMKAFATSGCQQCHFGPRLTNDAFHNTRTRSGRADGEPDLGRRRGVLVWRQSEFRADGRWSAAPELALQASDDPVSLGQFKTPSLRGVAEQAFFNDIGGSAASLAAVTEAYGTGGVAPGDPSCAGEREPWLKELSETAQWALVPFLQTLTVAPQAP